MIGFVSGEAHRFSDRVRDLSPAAKLVFFVFRRADGPLTPTEIAEESLLPDRTVRHAIRQLRRRDVVESRPSPTDARYRLYSLTEVDGAEA